MGNESSKLDSGSPRSFTQLNAETQKKISQGVSCNLKVLIRGSPKTGKTSLFRRLQSFPFRNEYIPTKEIDIATVGWEAPMQVIHSENVVKMELWDVADDEADMPGTKSVQRNRQSPPVNPDPSRGGSYKMLEMTSGVVDVYHGTHAMIVLFDPRNPASFAYIQRIVPEAPKRIPIAVVATYRDVLENQQRLLSTEEVGRWCQSTAKRTGQLVSYFEVSNADRFGYKYLSAFLNTCVLEARRRFLQDSLNETLTHISKAEAYLHDAFLHQNYAAYKQSVFRARESESLSSSPLSSPEATEPKKSLPERTTQGQPSQPSQASKPSQPSQPSQASKPANRTPDPAAVRETQRTSALEPEAVAAHRLRRSESDVSAGDTSDTSTEVLVRRNAPDSPAAPLAASSQHPASARSQSAKAVEAQDDEGGGSSSSSSKSDDSSDSSDSGDSSDSESSSSSHSSQRSKPSQSEGGPSLGPIESVASKEPASEEPASTGGEAEAARDPVVLVSEPKPAIRVALASPRDSDNTVARDSDNTVAQDSDNTVARDSDNTVTLARNPDEKDTRKLAQIRRRPSDAESVPSSAASSDVETSGKVTPNVLTFDIEEEGLKRKMDRGYDSAFSDEVNVLHEGDIDDSFFGDEDESSRRRSESVNPRSSPASSPHSRSHSFTALPSSPMSPSSGVGVLDGRSPSLTRHRSNGSIASTVSDGVERSLGSHILLEDDEGDASVGVEFRLDAAPAPAPHEDVVANIKVDKEADAPPAKSQSRKEKPTGSKKSSKKMQAAMHAMAALNTNTNAAPSVSAEAAAAIQQALEFAKADLQRRPEPPPPVSESGSSVDGRRHESSSKRDGKKRRHREDERREKSEGSHHKSHHRSSAEGSRGKHHSSREGRSHKSESRDRR